ncbi:MAG: ROK family protein [Gordonia sp. (in: high G+C Gram-positive bacteria)]|uniref:polyphosphate--glucose phosphotransferase n=1 Tax=Gordonia sp. (in: high G+C Gram-positive bacteria) TaxID=84139 RepID=UPI0039E70EC5
MADDTAPGKNLAFGIDIGGSGVKGAVVDLDTGEFVGERFRVETPDPSTPDLIADAVREVVDHFSWTGPVGLTVPGVVVNGVVRSVGNIDQSWVGTDTQKLFGDALGDRRIAVLNDADAAGLAELRYGDERARTGLVILLTFGTGIGSALLYNGVLVPNSELGHLELNGKIVERSASAKAKTDHDWGYPKWSKKVSKVLLHFERVLTPDLFIVGGGISKEADKWVPHLTNAMPVVPARLRNTAGIVGAAMAVNL